MEKNHTLTKDGFEIHHGVLPPEELADFRLEADRIAADSGRVCVRGIREKSTLIDRLSHSKTLLNLLPAGLQPVRSILFDKTPKQNWPVLWHQDLTIAVMKQLDVSGYGPWSEKDGVPHTQPPSSLLQQMVTIRLHLDDTDEDNGALHVIPGSHLLGKLPHHEVPTHSYSPSVICSCKAGDALIMSPLILHSSHRSKHPHRRRVIHVEYAPEGVLHQDLDWCEPSGNRRELPNPRKVI